MSGIDWVNGAVMNCEWKGPRLRDVLLRAGVDVDQESWAGKHVEFGCHQNPSSEEKWFGSSIPLEKAMAMNADVMVALEVILPLCPCARFLTEDVTADECFHR